MPNPIVHLNTMKNYSRIYLVDDFDMSNLIHKALIKKLQVGVEIKVFTKPEKALADLRLKIGKSERILILLDINMPEMSGFEFLDIMETEAFPHNIDVIIVSSSISEKDRAKAKEHPQFVIEFITKPLKLNRLSTVLKPLNKAG